MVATNLIAGRRRQILLAAGLRWQAEAGKRAGAAALSDMQGASAAETPERGARFDARQDAFRDAVALRAQGKLPVFIERKIGPTLDFLAAAPSEAARAAGRPVARIVTSTDQHLQAVGFASGFMVAAGLLLTNWHVFPDIAAATGAGANFGYEQGDKGLELGITFALEPARFFYSDETLDFALVGVAPTATTGEALVDQGIIVPSSATAKILIGQPIDIIQYPDGGPKEYATTNNKLVDILEDGFLHYETDTLEGSSGSPAFSEVWELVALHHAGIPEVKDGKIMTIDGTAWTEEMGEDQVKWVANEGIRISAVIKALAKVTLADPAQAALLKAVVDAASDPADDINKVTAGIGATSVSGQPAPERVAGVAPVATASGGGAGAISLLFTGPVTINVYPGSAPAVSAPPMPDPEIAPEKTLRFDPDYAHREGYDPGFLGDGLTVLVPSVASERAGEMFLQDGRVAVLPYHHYSLTMNATRRLTMWTAVNVDYDPSKRGGGRASFGTDKWVVDPRVPVDIQTRDADVYGPAGQVDRGHIVRRQDNAWGDTPEALEFANSDTFHWTNCTPQHAAFNRASPPTTKYGKMEGIWGGFEVYIQSQLQKGDTRASILAGPILASDDPVFVIAGRSIQVPMAFWKVVIVVDPAAAKGPALRAYGFILSQDDVLQHFGIEFAPGRYARLATPLAEITRRSGVVFDPALLAAEAAANFVDVPTSG